MKVCVAIAWRPTPERLPAYRHVLSLYAAQAEAAMDFGACIDIITVDTPHVPYNLAAVRNEGVRQAEARGADVVVLADADVVVTPWMHVQDAIIQAHEDGRAHLPFTLQRYLTAEETAEVIAGADPGSYPGVGVGNGCCYVITPEAYWAMHGSDERFSGWGGDDDQFVAAASTLIGLVRHKGVALSLHHADERRPVGTAEHRPNSLLARRYWSAKGDPAAMRRIIAERPAASVPAAT